MTENKSKLFNQNYYLTYNIMEDLKNKIRKKTNFKGNPIIKGNYSKSYLKYIRKNPKAPVKKSDIVLKGKVVKKDTIYDKRYKTKNVIKPKIAKQLGLDEPVRKLQEKLNIYKFEVSNTNNKYGFKDYKAVLKDPTKIYSKERKLKNISRFLKTLPDNISKRFIAENVEGQGYKGTSTKFMNNLNYEFMLDSFNNASEDSLLVVDGNDSNITIQTNSPVFGGKYSLPLPKWLENTKCLFPIYNTDNLCGQRCLAVSLITDYNKRENLKKKDRQEKNKDYNKLVKEICENINIDGTMEITDFEEFAKIYKKYVMIFQSKTNPISTEDYREDKEDETDIIYIYLDITTNHYWLITNINVFTGFSTTHTYKFCNHCRKSFTSDKIVGHKCIKNKCRCCGEYNDCKKDWGLWNIGVDLEVKYPKQTKTKRIKGNALHCHVCGLNCVNEKCLENHIINNHSYKSKKRKGELKECDVFKCFTCKSWADKQRYLDEVHNCGEKKCLNCEEYYMGDNHSCNIMRTKKTEKSMGEGQNYYCFDFESMFDDNLNHKVNLIKVGKLYDDEFMITFRNLKQFMEWFSTLEKSTLIAHNGKSYDTWLIFNEMERLEGERPKKIVLAGQKIMYMETKKCRFIDSLNFVNSTLAKFPKTFGLDENKFKKGFFPYLMNTKEYKDYLGEFPNIELFEPNKMSSRKDFDKWYNKHKIIYDEEFNNVIAKKYNITPKTKKYDFDKELNEYCESDVRILTKSMEVFRDNMKRVNDGLDPLQCVTIASYCMKVFLTNHVPTEKELDGEIEEERNEQSGISILKKEDYNTMKRGFFGGRTEVFKLYKKWSNKDVKQGKYGKYVDIVSLYPTSQFLDYLPYGQPKHYVFNEGDQVDINNYFGMIRCDIECPKNLHIPLLGGKQITPDGTEKFQFGLNDMKDVVYSSEELKKALTLGYKITRVYEIYHFKKSKELFKSYIRTMIKGKICGGGHSGTYEEKLKFCEEYKTKYGIDVKPDELVKNAGLKAVSKSAVTNLWGKFGQRQMAEDKYMNADEWFKLKKRYDNDEVDILAREDLGDAIYVKFQEKKDLKTSLRKTNVAICAMLTANARLRLYEELEKLNERVCYCDTDSIIYEYDESKYNVKTGKLLGDWEAEGEEDHIITEFCGIAPKAYSYKLKGEKSYEIKSKGIRMTEENKRLVTFDSYKNLIDNQKIIKVDKMDFKKTKKGIQTIHSKKDIAFDPKQFKRQIINKYETLPYGIAV
jgi:hypothetical protein